MNKTSTSSASDGARWLVHAALIPPNRDAAAKFDSAKNTSKKRLQNNDGKSPSSTSARRFPSAPLAGIVSYGKRDAYVDTPCTNNHWYVRVAASRAQIASLCVRRSQTLFCAGAMPFLRETRASVAARCKVPDGVDCNKQVKKKKKVKWTCHERAPSSLNDSRWLSSLRRSRKF